MTEESKDKTVKEKMTTSDGSKIWSITREIIETVVTVLFLVIVIRNFIGEPRWIPSASMRPTLMEGDRLIVEKVSSYFTKPHRGDIIVFYPPGEELKQDPWAKFTRLIGYFNSDTAYIKRIIGMPGDTIEIRNGMEVIINGKPLKESYKNDSYPIECRDNMICGPVKIPNKEYFMMGDNRGNSQDSRFWGFLPEKRIIGKAYFRFWPITRIGPIDYPKY